MAHRKQQRADTRDKKQVHDSEAEAQNVTDGSKPLNEEETSHARAKAREGQQQGRDKPNDWNRNQERNNDELNK